MPLKRLGKGLRAPKDGRNLILDEVPPFPFDIVSCRGEGQVRPTFFIRIRLRIDL